jgi:hypothetical protein
MLTSKDRKRRILIYQRYKNGLCIIQRRCLNIKNLSKCNNKKSNYQKKLKNRYQMSKNN